MIHLDYKRAFITWIKTLEMVDTGVQTGNRFLRVIGYRGHKSQAKDIADQRDIHVHRLHSPGDLFSLTPDVYKALVKGRPNYEASMAWLDDIIPVQPMPEAWAVFLKDWKIRQKIQDSVFCSQYSSAIFTDNAETIKQVQTHLDKLGITHTEQTSGDMWFLRLNRCPICDRAGAWVTHTGRLKCFHANTCEAGQSGEHGIKGLSPGQWIDGFEYVEAEAVSSDITYQTKDDLRAMVTREVLTPGNKLVSIPPGCGKTHSTIKALAPLSDTKKILYCSPTHMLNGETAELAASFAPEGVEIVHLFGRSEDTCQEWDSVEPLQMRGFSPGVMYCWGCPWNMDCRYKNQFQTLKDASHGFFIVSHAMVAGWDLDGLGIDILIVDEDPLACFFEKISKNYNHIQVFFKSYQGAFPVKLYAALQRIFSTPPPEGSDINSSYNRLYAGKLPAEHNWADMPDLWELGDISQDEENHLFNWMADNFGQFEDEPKSKYLWRLFNKGVDLNAFRVLMALIGHDPSAYCNIKLKPKNPDSNKEIFQFVKTERRLPSFSGQIIVLDGTGILSEVEALFNAKFDHVHGSIEITAEKTLINRGLGKRKCELMRKNNPTIFKTLMVDAIRFLRPQDKKVLIATHIAIEPDLLNIAQGLLPGRELDSIHFYGNKGSNAHKDYDAVICFGQPGTNQPARFDEAMLLYDDAKDRRAWFDHKADAEALQSIHRIRPINGHKNIILLNRKWLSDLGPLETHFDTRRGGAKEVNSIQRAMGRMDRFYKVHGFLTLQVLKALGIGILEQKDHIKKVMFPRSFCHNSIYYNSNRTLKLSPFSNEIKPDLILFRDKRRITDLMTKFALENVGQNYEEKFQDQWTKAFGSIDGAKVFYRVLGKKFDPEYWRRK